MAAKITAGMSALALGFSASTREEAAEPAAGESYPGPTRADPTVPGSAVAGEAIRKEPVPGPDLVLHSEEEQERGEVGAEERPLTEVPTWLKRREGQKR